MEDDFKAEKISSWGANIMGCGLFVTVCILGYQGYQWIKGGGWPPIPLYKVLEYLGFNFVGILDLKWVGAQKIIFWIFEQPLAGVIGVSSLVVGWLMMAQD